MSSDSDARAEAWLDRARAALRASELAPKAEEIGRVEEVGDGVVIVSGLPGVELDELVRFERGQFGFAQGLDRDRTICVALEGLDVIQAGDAVRRSGDVVRVPVGPGLLGRILDPLGRPLDGGPDIVGERFDPIERPAPSIIERDRVTQPVQTGWLVIDALFPLGRGQRELIIGDRALGQKTSSVRRSIDALKAHGAFERCIVVTAGPATSPGMQWIAPFSGFTMAEYWRDKGQHALVVLDDLTKHAASHREIALLTRQSPGREAYPGDVFHVHARLLERAAKLSLEKGGGSLTALPIAETDAGNLSAFIPTNLISITDGQIVLDSKLFYEGLKPAVDVGSSVSRVGGQTQAQALRRAAQTLRLTFAQFLELEMFTRFGGVQEPRVRSQLARGERIRAILAQPQHAPLRLVDEVALALAAQSGLLDATPTSKIPAFRAGLRDRLDSDAPDLVSRIETTGLLDDAMEKRLTEVLAAYAIQCAADGSPTP